MQGEGREKQVGAKGSAISWQDLDPWDRGEQDGNARLDPANFLEERAQSGDALFDGKEFRGAPPALLA